MFQLSTSLKKLIPHLPRYSEEGNFSTSVKKLALQDILTDSGLSSESATLLLEMIEALLSSVVTLELDALQHGEWRFVSFPAQLCAFSLLHTLADNEQRLVNPHFWKAAEHDNELQAQFANLHWLEASRIENHDRQSAPPIRFIYVAWALIKLDGQFLLHRREANRIRDGNGEYVLIGGRMNIHDLIKVVPQKTNENRLRLLQQPPPDVVNDILINTLQREIQEETHLLFRRDYTINSTPWRCLKPYRALSGAKANHAYTEYHIQIFTINLTQSGFFRFCEIEQLDKLNFKRFSIDEIVAGRTTDGKTAYLDALYSDYDDDLELLKTDLVDRADVFSNVYRFYENFTLPLIADGVIEKGDTGRETALNFRLNSEQSMLLCGLAAHAKGFKFKSLNKGVKLLGCGWLEVSNKIVSKDLEMLAEYLRDKNYPLVEIEQGRYFRLSITPEKIFFDSGYFVYDLIATTRRNRWTFVLQFEEVKTPFGVVLAHNQKTDISDKVKNRLELYEQQELSEAEEAYYQLPDNIKKTIERNLALNVIGLRKLVRSTGGDKYRIACQFKKDI